MIGVATGLCANLRIGVKIFHYGISFLSALVGAIIAMRQICLHICPGFPVFGIPVWGFGLYTWSFFVFGCSLCALTFFLLLHEPCLEESRDLLLIEKIAIFCVILLALSNTITTFQECGLGACHDVPWPQPKS